MKKEWLWFFLLALIIIILLPWSILRWQNDGRSAEDLVIRVLMEDGKTVKMPLEEYLIGVVAAEMPAEFRQEALEAQAVAARTFAVKRLSKRPVKDEGYDVDTTVKTQVWLSDEQMHKKWGMFTYWNMRNKVKKAVDSTRGRVLVFEGDYIEAFYHSSSGRKLTERSEDVWGSSRTYLENVSSGEENPLRFKKQVSFSPKELVGRLGQTEGPKAFKPDDFKLISRTKAGRIKNMSILGKNYAATQLRTLLGLASTDIEWVIKPDQVNFTTYGYGHAVGMSQYGANDLAQKKLTYDKILEHYYPGAKIMTLGHSTPK
ncbi:MAG: stage II sporulation protein D [Desulfitobacteriaceae bacterium]